MNVLHDKHNSATVQYRVQTVITDIERLDEFISLNLKTKISSLCILLLNKTFHYKGTCFFSNNDYFF